MAADPIKAAEDLAGQTYSSAQDRTAAGKKALLDGLAANGTYQNTVNLEATKAAAPTQQPAAPGDGAYPQLTALSQAGAQQVQAMNHVALGAAATLAAQQQAAQQRAASTYFDQVSAAVPIEQSRATSDAQQIMAQLVQEREDRANSLKLQQLQLQETQSRIAAADRASAAAAAKAAGTDALSPNERIAVEQAAVDSALPLDLTYVKDPAGGYMEQLTPVGEAVSYLSDNPQDLEAYFNRAGLTGQQQEQVIQGLNNYTSYLQSQHYYGTGQRPVYTNPLHAENVQKVNSVLFPKVAAAPAPAAAPKTKAPAQSYSKDKATHTPIFGPTGAVLGYK